jgi:plasmid stability protein
MGNGAFLEEIEVVKSNSKCNQSETMATLTIKNVPENLHERLKERAERNRRSMNSEAIWILEQVLTPSRRSAEEAIAQAKALNDRIGKTFPDVVDEAKRKGRA